MENGINVQLLVNALIGHDAVLRGAHRSNSVGLLTHGVLIKQLVRDIQ